jgi:hypothetical protein
MDNFEAELELLDVIDQTEPKRLKLIAQLNQTVRNGWVEIAEAKHSNELYRHILHPQHLTGGVPSVYITQNDRGLGLRGSADPAFDRMRISIMSPYLLRA